MDAAEKATTVPWEKRTLFPSAALGACARDQAFVLPPGGTESRRIHNFVLGLEPVGVGGPRTRALAPTTKFMVVALTVPAGEPAKAVTIPLGKRDELRHGEKPGGGTRRRRGNGE